MLRWFVSRLWDPYVDGPVTPASAPLADRSDLAQLVRLLQEDNSDQTADGDSEG